VMNASELRLLLQYLSVDYRRLGRLFLRFERLRLEFTRLIGGRGIGREFLRSSLRDFQKDLRGHIEYLGILREISLQIEKCIYACLVFFPVQSTAHSRHQCAVFELLDRDARGELL